MHGMRSSKNTAAWGRSSVRRSAPAAAQLSADGRAAAAAAAAVGHGGPQGTRGIGHDSPFHVEYQIECYTHTHTLLDCVSTKLVL